MDIVYVHATAINGKRGHDFEREQGGICYEARRKRGNV